MTADPADWSKPTLVQVTEPTAALPEVDGPPDPPAEVDAPAEPPAEAEVDVPAERSAEVEPSAEVEAEPEPAPEPEPEPEPEPQPEAGPEPAPWFTSVPVATRPVSRAPRTVYPAGTEPSWQDKLVDRVADVAVVAMPIPLRVLDVGCGDARLLTELILRVPNAELYLGVDPRSDAVPGYVRAAEPRLSVIQATAEALPLRDASFDLVLTSLSLSLWVDQQAGAAELARVVSDNGKVVVVETRKPQLSGRNRVHGVKEISKLLEAAGLTVERVETVHRSATQVSMAHAFIASP